MSLVPQREAEEALKRHRSAGRTECRGRKDTVAGCREPLGDVPNAAPPPTDVLRLMEGNISEHQWRAAAG